MKEIREFFVERDGLTQDEANEMCNNIRAEIDDIICVNGGYQDVEDLLLGYGLEMDYLMDLI